MAVSPPKGNRADWLVEKLAEIGVKRLVPLQTERTVVAPGDAKLVRWRRKCVEAAKQARRAVVMEVVGAATLADVLSTAAQGTDLLFGDAAATTPTLVEHLLDRGGDATAQSRAAMFLIGPEGGFTPDETAAMTRAGARAVRLNDGVLRIETAAIVAATIWRAHALRHAERPPNPRSTRNSSV